MRWNNKAWAAPSGPKCNKPSAGLFVYSIESDHLFIIAIAHQHRKPDYWVGQ